MAVKYRRWDADDRVSAQWYAVLSAAKADGVSFLVTDGHRTMAEQQDRWDTYQRFGHPVAARPGPSAPHIRLGRPDHAIDVNALDGGAQRLAAWLRTHGAAASFPVHNEAWHIEVPRDDLERLAKKVADPLAGFPAKERHWIRAYDALVRMKHAGHDPADGSERRASLRRLMTDRRKAIWRAAQHSGWHQLKRRARYRTLLARTTNP
jgi:hypothetical protein